MIPLRSRWVAFKLKWSCKLWDLRGLPDCPYHGIHAQSWWTGYCKECGEIPVIPPMEDTCTFCSEEKAVLQRASPNSGEKEVWSLCWECDKYIDWSFENSWYNQAEGFGLDMTRVKEVKPFGEWLFEKHKVYPKGEYTGFVLRKKNETR